MRFQRMMFGILKANIGAQAPRKYLPFKSSQKGNRSNAPGFVCEGRWITTRHHAGSPCSGVSTRQGPCQRTWSEIKAGPAARARENNTCAWATFGASSRRLHRSKRAGRRGGAKLQPRTGKLVMQGREDTGTRLRAVIPLGARM